ncbi:hypothetical protein GRI72_14445 [Altererythrobacter marinus]|uniref:Uncharacterized protein n=1 Tax=Pelagerythrobacter marinus TaxID=538382 RepID=A0ABW9UYU6_9SPHN|nr:hypothetical protein [Pelagerythrobacter marinus]MXO70001.1 hypothetical protein [Pelagerythrobacter marinus]
MPIITSHSPWVINYAIELDRHMSFCGEFFRASSERQHVVAAYLNARPPRECNASLVAEFLLRSRHGEILSAAFQNVPVGLRPALRRAGAVVHPERFYTLLVELLSCGESYITRCIAQVPRLDLDALLVIEALPPEACSPSLIQAVSGSADAKDVSTAFHVLVENGVDADWLADCLRDVKTQSSLSSVFQKAARRAIAPPHPVPASDFYQPIRTGEELFSVAREFRNCLRNYTCSFLDERQGNAFAVASRAEHRTVVHLVRGTAGWKLEGLFKSRNRRPSRPTREWIESYLREHGVIIEGRETRKPSRWDSVHNLIFGDLLDFQFGFDVDELDHVV